MKAFHTLILLLLLENSTQQKACGQSPYELAKQQVKYGPLVGPAQPPPGYQGSSYNQRQSVIGPLGGGGYSANRGGAYVAPDGSTVEYSSQSRGVRGPLGAAAGTRITETKVTAASGNAYVWSGSTQRAAVGPYGGVAVRRRGIFLRP